MSSSSVLVGGLPRRAVDHEAVVAQVVDEVDGEALGAVEVQ